MNRTWGCVAILILIAAIILSGTLTVAGETAAMRELLTDARAAAERGEFEAAKTAVEKINTRWKTAESRLRLFISHADINDIAFCISGLLPLIEQRNEALFLSEISRAKTFLQHIAEMERFQFR